jgi:hypothetical protein
MWRMLLSRYVILITGLIKGKFNTDYFRLVLDENNIYLCDIYRFIKIKYFLKMIWYFFLAISEIILSYLQSEFSRCIHRGCLLNKYPFIF